MRVLKRVVLGHPVGILRRDADLERLDPPERAHAAAADLGEEIEAVRRHPKQKGCARLHYTIKHPGGVKRRVYDEFPAGRDSDRKSDDADVMAEGTERIDDRVLVEV